MKNWRKINPDTGMFIEDVILTELPLLKGGEPDPAYVAEPVPPDAGFYHPRWDGAAWTEGLTPEEIAARQVPPEPTPEEAWKASVEAALIKLAAGSMTLADVPDSWASSAEDVLAAKAAPRKANP